MSLARLKIDGVRNLKAVDLGSLAHTNVFFGANGSGKTSILEAIHILGLARSFRGSKIKPVINHDMDTCTVFGELHSPGYSEAAGVVSMGVSRDKHSNHKIRINSDNVYSTAELAEYLPLLTINAESFGLLAGAPAIRRHYLDWSVFHVEPRFYSEWKRYQRCIKQRNTLLRRDKIDDALLAVWTKELAESGEAVDKMRQLQFSKLAERFTELASSLSGSLKGVELSYYRGWDREKSLAEALANGLDTDKERGFTQLGAHRADLRIKDSGKPAIDVLSRGQIKLAVCALKLTQGQVYTEHSAKTCVYLIDDLPSELDHGHLETFCKLLQSLKSQIFITSVEYEAFYDDWLGFKSEQRFSCVPRGTWKSSGSKPR